jgi:hypothetical protein
MRLEGVRSLEQGHRRRRGNQKTGDPKSMKDKILEIEIQNPKNEETKSKREKSNDEDQYRVVINKESNEALEAMTRRTNDGFEGGEVSKSDIANFIFVGAAKSFSDADIKTLRQMHFDEKRVLRSMLKKAGGDGNLPEEIKRALREHFGMSDGSKKRASKPQNELSTERPVDNSPTS